MTNGELLAAQIDAHSVANYISGLIELDWEISDEDILAYQDLKMNDDGSFDLYAKDGRVYRITVTQVK